MTYVASRLLSAILLILGVFTIVFMLVRMSGDPAQLYLPVEASEQQVMDLREQMGLDQPLFRQYLIGLGGLLKGDMGKSFGYGKPAIEVIGDSLGATLQLIGSAMLIAIILAFPLGILAAIFRGTWIDSLATMFSLFGQGLPTFWWALMLMLLFSVHWPLLPSSGAGSLAHLVLPAVTLGSFLAGAQVRVIRSAFLETLRTDFIRTAKGKGLSKLIVIFKHAAKPALPTILTLITLQLGQLIGGAVVTEYVFAFPGMGRLLVYAVQVRDFALTQAFVVITATFIVSANLFVDVVITFIDPKVHLA